MNFKNIDKKIKLIFNLVNIVKSKIKTVAKNIKVVIKVKLITTLFCISKTIKLKYIFLIEYFYKSVKISNIYEEIWLLEERIYDIIYM